MRSGQVSYVTPPNLVKSSDKSFSYFKNPWGNRMIGVRLRGIGLKGFGFFRLQVVGVKSFFHLVKRDLFSLLNEGMKDFSITIQALIQVKGLQYPCWLTRQGLSAD